MKNRSLLAASATVAVALIYLFAFGPGRFRVTGEPGLAARISEAAILERTRPLVANLWPDLQNVQLTPELALIPDGICSPIHPKPPITAAWMMVCENTRGRPLGTITWNAASGDLLSIVAGTATPCGSEMAFPQMKPTEARKVMHQWIRELAALSSGAAWLEIGARSEKNVFISDWRAGERTAHLSVNSWTGDLIVLRVASR